MEERRKTIRITESFKVDYQVVKSFRMVSSRSQDISEGGICLPVLQRLQPKMVLDLEIYLEGDKKPIKAVGEVVWLKDIKDLKFLYLSGIKFIKIAPEAASRLKSYIDKKAASEHVKWLEKNEPKAGD
ncbi:MAG: PilZ domain-containing protein [Candidatus Omnitrophota bacterium]